MMTLLKLLEKFNQLEWKSKKEFIKAYMYTGFFRAYILFIPFRKLAKRMGKVKCESPEEVDKDTYFEAERIGSIVSKASKYTFWKSLCLVQALTAQKLLGDKNIRTTIYLGVLKDKKNNIIAHAWTRCGKYFVTGGENNEMFTVVAKFSN
ncbi:lasso peptide biosynthesis B2 protein [Clostridium butyricum]|uniref:lasso peptide biosynthesis B2 protein n=1 Tax=Clostridium butyricum TaxID=1492 RepID=UPI001F576B91|nr:lasso peptide biosynthesis B2 protein [Clostridium butyricum]